MAEQADQIAYQTNRDGIFVGVVKRQPSPLEPGVFLIPAGAVLVAPPKISEGEMAVWDGQAWSLKPIPPQPKPKLEEPPMVEPSPEMVAKAQAEAQAAGEAPVEAAPKKEKKKKE